MSSRAFRTRINAVADFLFPRRCLACGEINPKGIYKHICGDCATTAMLCTGGRCLICGEIIGGKDSPNVRGCPKCFDIKTAYDEAFCPTVFDGTAKQLIHALKYASAPYAATDLAKLALRHPDTEIFLQNATIVPVPLHWLRRFKRGYNQTEIIARQIVKIAPRLNIKIADILKRTRRTSTQTKLSREARMENIKGAFALKAGVKLPPKDAPIILLDDVMTTTATINECAKTLKRAGFKNIRAFAVAKKI